MEQFENRTQAGELLAYNLKAFKGMPNLYVLAIPKGGIPIGIEVARFLEAPFDLCMVQRMMAPGGGDLPIGVVSLDGKDIMNSDVISRLNITEDEVDNIFLQKREYLRECDQIFRDQQPFPDLEDKFVIIVDDGMTTGISMKSAVDQVLKQMPQSVTVAIPTAPTSVLNEFVNMVDQIVCLRQDNFFLGVEAAYKDYKPVSHDDIRPMIQSYWFESGDDRCSDLTYSS